MSKHWGYVCQSHDPELVSERWFNHGQEILRDAWTAEKSGTLPTGDDFWYEDAIFVNGHNVQSAVSWLRDHPNCNVALRNEYGDTEPIVVG